MMKMDNFESKLILHELADTLVGGSQTQVFLNHLAAASQVSPHCKDHPLIYQVRPSKLVRSVFIGSCSGYLARNSFYYYSCCHGSGSYSF